jgi:putative ABC transport system permease protein
MTIQMIYPMIETMNVYKDLLQPTAPHYQQFMAQKMLSYQGEAGMRQYVLEKLCNENGVSETSALGVKLGEYVNGLDAMTLQTEFYTRLSTEYASRLATEPEYYNEAVAALFDQYRADMVANHAADYAALYKNHMAKSDSTYEENLIAVGASAGHDALTAINIYPVDFEAKERLQQLITDYNAAATEEDQIAYTDIMAIMMSSVTVIIDAITYVLVAFVSISLVVSSIMIGIITYISVLERTKEIGILRAIGASKRDISRVFNAETLIIGFAAGLIGILSTLLFCIPINLIIHALSGLTNINAVLPFGAALILVAISMGLTLIAGLIPSRIASKKDPVVALRTE